MLATKALRGPLCEPRAPCHPGDFHGLRLRLSGRDLGSLVQGVDPTLAKEHVMVKQAQPRLERSSL